MLCLARPDCSSASASAREGRKPRSGREAKPLRPNFAEWELDLPTSDGHGSLVLSAFAEDAAGNVEPRPHQWRVGQTE